MKRTHRIRRVGAAALLGMGMTAGVIGVTAGVAGAVTAAHKIGLAAVSSPTVKATGATQTAGNLTISIPAGDAFVATSTLTLAVPTSVIIDSAKITPATDAVATAATATLATAHHAKFTLKANTGAAETLTIKTIKYTTTHTAGAITVTPTFTTHAATDTFSFTPTHVANATAKVINTGTATISAATVPQVAISGTSQSAGDLSVTFAAGDTITATAALTLTVPSTVTWTAGTVTAASTEGAGAGGSTFTGHVATIHLAAKSTTTTAKTLKVTGITYTTASASGKITVTPALSGVTFTPTSVANATTVSSNTGSSISASKKTGVPATGTGNAAGTLTVKLHVLTESGATAGDVYLTVAPANGNSGAHYVKWNHVSVGGSGLIIGTVTGTAGAGSKLTIPFSAATKGATDTITVTGITYNTKTAQGTIKVTPTWTYTGASPQPIGTDTAGTFTPATAVNAVSSAGVPAGATTITVNKLSTPAIGVGTTGTAGNEKVVITGSSATNKAGWTAGGSLTLTASRTSTCNATKQFLAFSGTPTVTYTATTSSGASTTPKVTASLASTGICTTAGKDNELKLTFTNTVTLARTGSTAGKAIFIISGIKYAAGATDVHGAVSVAMATSSTFSATHPTPTGTPGNADIAYAYVSTTPVTTSPGAYDHAITPVKVVEAKGHTVPTGYVCLTLSTGTFNTSASASVKTTGGGSAGSAVSYKTTAKTAMFDVTKASTATHPSTFTVSGLAINAPSNTSGVTVTVTARDGETATCAATGGTTLLTTAVGATASPNTETVLMTLHSTTQIYGATAAATAVKLLETSFVHCPGTGTTGKDSRPVVIATETHFQDALSAQYLASDLHTGVLLTSYGSLPTVTIQALKTEGVTQVDIVGGPLAVSTAVQKQLETLPAYTCGGTSQLKTSGHVRTITVTRIYGQTAEGTAQAIDSLIPSTHVAKEAFVTAYVGVNANKGTGMYNTTAGLSSAPTTTAAVPTVIMASGTEFQDAMAASTLSYWRKSTKSLPIVLTSPTALTANAAGALATTGAKQVILMGGQLAVTNSVVTTLVSDGIEVLRIAGQNYTGTAAELAKFEYGTGTKGVGWTSHVVAVARGNGFTDGLVGAVVAGSTTPTTRTGTTTPEPLVLTLNPTTVGTTLTAFLKAYGATGPTATNGKITSLQIFGGPLAVSPSVISQMQSDIA